MKTKTINNVKYNRFKINSTSDLIEYLKCDAKFIDVTYFLQVFLSDICQLI